MDNELAFGADCVIRLQDFGQLKDYTDTIDNLIVKLKDLKSKDMPLICDELIQVIEADPQDTFYLPSFKHFLSMIFDQDWIKYNLKEEQQKSIIKFELAIIEQNLFSFTFSEQIFKKMVKRCEAYVQLEVFQNVLLYILFKLSQKIAYIDDQEAIITLFNYLQEDLLFGSTQIELVNVKVASYLQICEKLLRSHRIRQKFNLNFRKDSYIFLCKLSLWNKQRQQFQKFKKEIEDYKYFASTFLQKALNTFQKVMLQ